MIRQIMYDDMYQACIRWMHYMIRIIMDDELQDVAPDDMYQDDAMMMIRMIM